VAAANRDRGVLRRVFGNLIFLFGVINMAPTLLFWNRWSEQILAPTLPQWVYWQIFIAAICLVYAVFLIQIADWSALKSVSIVMLVMAMGYGLVTASLVLGGAQSPAARWLSLDAQVLDRGKTWCATMLCVATLISYFPTPDCNGFGNPQMISTSTGLENLPAFSQPPRGRVT